MILARTEKQEERRDVSEGRGGVVMDLGFGYVDVFIDDDRKKMTYVSAPVELLPCCTSNFRPADTSYQS